MPWVRQKVSATARGYGRDHKKLREQWEPLVATGSVRCWRCHEFISPGVKWHLGHDDFNRGVYRGPEHAKCNLSGAAKKARLVQMLGKNTQGPIDRW